VDELLRRSVLKPGDVLSEAFRVDAVPGRNGARLVRSARTAVLVKRLEDSSREVRGLIRCADPSANVWVPKLRFVSETLVATETAASLKPVSVSARSGKYPRWVAEALGSNLARLHRVPINGDDPPVGHLPFDPDGSTTAALDESPAVRALLASYYEDAELVEGVRFLARQMRNHRSAFTHGDIRAGNVLADTKERRICLIDWEMCGSGDPMIDVGAAIALLLSGSLMYSRGSPDRSNVRALLAAYRASSGSLRLESALRCAGSVLLQFSLESVSDRLEPSSYSRRASAVGRLGLVTPTVLALHLHLAQ